MLRLRDAPSRISMTLDSESSSPQHPPQKTLSKPPVHTQPWTHTLFDVDPSFSDLMTEPPDIRPRLSDDRTIIPTTETWDQTIGTALCSRSKRLEHVAQAHHASVQDDLHFTTTDVESFQNRFQREAALRSPVTRLPPEILAYIFELYLVGESTTVFIPARGPFCLAHVCKLWRAIAESDPHLWTSIHFHFPDRWQSCEGDVSRVKPVFDLHLKRSGALPISFTFTDHRFYHAATEDLISLLVDRLRSHSRRWKYISLHLSCGYFPLLFTFMPCDLSTLEHLYISGDVLGQRIVTTLRLNLESAKKLKSFAYSGPGHSLDDKIDLHWEQLAEVAFEFAPHNGMSSTLSRQFRRLAQCQNLTTCSLGIDRPFWLDFDQTIILPCLRTLRVRRLSPQSHARTVIDPLVLPKLRTLEIDAAMFAGLDDWNPSWHDRNFSHLLARSGCALRHLSIQDVHFTNDELVRCLTSSHALTSFRFIPYPRSQDIVDVVRKFDVSEPAVPGQGGGLTASRTETGQKHIRDGPLVPELRELTLASSIEGYLDLVMATCRSRVGPRAAEAAPLRRVEVVFFDTAHDCGTMPPEGRSVPGDRLGRVTSVREELARWASENAWGIQDKETSVVVHSPDLAEYINLVR